MREEEPTLRREGVLHPGLPDVCRTDRGVSERGGVCGTPRAGGSGERRASFTCPAQPIPARPGPLPRPGISQSRTTISNVFKKKKLP